MDEPLAETPTRLSEGVLGGRRVRSAPAQPCGKFLALGALAFPTPVPGWALSGCWWTGRRNAWKSVFLMESYKQTVYNNIVAGSAK